MDPVRPFENIDFEEAKKLYGDLIGVKRLLFYKVINLLVMNRHDADEVFQEAMLLGWENRHQLRSESSFVAWMIQIIRSVAAKKRDLEQKDRRIWNVLFQAIQNSFPLRTHAHNPEGQMISEEEKTVAMNAYERLPDTERIIYGLYHAEDYSQAEIGQMLDMPQETVRNHLHRAQGRLEKRMHSMVIAFLAEHLCHDSPSILVQQVIDKISASSVSAETAATTTVTAAAGAGIAEKAALGGFFTTLALPFLWIASLLISGTVSTTAFVRSMPTLQARRWLIKHLMIFYVLSVSIMISRAIIEVYVRKYLFGFETCNRDSFYISVFLFSLVGVYVFWLNRRYRKIFIDGLSGLSHSCCKDEEAEFVKFQNCIDKGLWVAFAFICLWVLFLLRIPVDNIFRHDTAYLHKKEVVYTFVFVFGFGFIIYVLHHCVVKLFRYFVNISRDATIFRSTRDLNGEPQPLIEHQVKFRNESNLPTSLDRCPPDSAPLHREGTPSVFSLNINKSTFYLRELLFVSPFLLIFPGSNIIHLLFVRTRVTASLIELFVYLSLWGLVLKQNRQTSSLRWSRIWLALLVQMILFFGLRQFVY